MQLMSTPLQPPTASETGVPELSALGRRLEMLRIERGLSKQDLARLAETSRQQLWRVMTGKSELTTSLCQRLADALGIDSRVLRNPEAFAGTIADVAGAAVIGAGAGVNGELDRPGRIARRAHAEHVPSVAEYLADPRWIARTLATCPGGPEGRLLKRRLLDGLEDAAREAGVRLPPSFFTVRGRVVNGEL
jgi:transcriptional regulator with XRE-family HTH domain